MRPVRQYDEPSEEEIQKLTELSLASGVMKRKSANDYCSIRLAYHPFRSSQQLYTLIENITKVWQKLILKASQSYEFIQKVYKSIQCNDPMISKMIHILRQKDVSKEESVFNFTRYDYFINQEGLPKLIEYNLFSVSMSSHIQRFQQVRKLCDCKNSKSYINNKPNELLIGQIKKVYDDQQLQGYFLFIIPENESNIIQQRIIELGLLKHNICSKRITLVEAGLKLTRDAKNNLKINEDTISMVYFRSGYNLSHYQANPHATWKARQIIELSNAIKIPSITMDLLNQKRMQVELSKQVVFSQYLTKQQGQLLKLSLVKQWQFDHMENQEFDILMKEIQSKKDQYILKPNLEGGGNNIYGEQVYRKLKQLSPQSRKQYILMEKIHSTPEQNIIISNNKPQKFLCDYEISQYGLIYTNKINKGQVITNKPAGFLIRIKPITENEGGIMGGVGSLCSWMVEKESNS